MNAKAFHVSVQGASHIRKGKECQDYSGSFFDERCAIAIVCDGHGGDDYMRSAVGAEYAYRAAIENISQFVQETDLEHLRRDSAGLIRSLEAGIITVWNEMVRAHWISSPFTEEELAQVSAKARQKYERGDIESAYGTTLVAAAVTSDYWFAIQIGDGKCVAVTQDGRFGQPIPPNDKCFLNATTSICDSNALDNFRHRFSEKLPAAIFVGSDGVDDCFKNKEQLYNLYKTVLYSFTQSDFETAVEELGDYLPRLSERGSGDDVSVAAILDLEKAGQLQAIRDYDAQKEKERVEAHARAEAERLAEEKRLADEKYERLKAERLERERLEAERREQERRERLERERRERERLEAERRERLERERRLAEERRRQQAVSWQPWDIPRVDEMTTRKYCPFCRRYWPKEANFCQNCSAMLTLVSTRRTQSADQSFDGGTQAAEPAAPLPAEAPAQPAETPAPPVQAAQEAAGPVPAAEPLPAEQTAEVPELVLQTEELPELVLHTAEPAPAAEPQPPSERPKLDPLLFEQPSVHEQQEKEDAQLQGMLERIEALSGQKDPDTADGG